MALVLSNLIFVHIPKTGGSWVVDTLKDACRDDKICFEVPYKNPDFPAMLNHPPIDAIPREHSQLSFTIIRDPLEWYQSYWCHRQRFGWEHPHALDDYVRDTEFTQCMRKFIEKYPAFVTKMYRRYTQGVDFVGTKDRMRDQLEALLKTTGQQHDPSVLDKERPSRTASRSLPEYFKTCQYPPNLAEEIKELEKEAYG